MLSVKNNTNTIIIKNSKFICLLYQVNEVEQVYSYLEKAKNNYKDATHYCYAYIINNISKCSDDGEPSNTAGLPILQVLKYNKLNNVLCIVVRYFGKILLGAGGLVRAYTKSVTECLKDHIVNLERGYNITITFNYQNLKQINYIIKNINILEKNFKNDITYNLNVNMNTYNELKTANICTIKINNDIYL